MTIDSQEQQQQPKQTKPHTLHKCNSCRRVPLSANEQSQEPACSQFTHFAKGREI